MLRTFELIEIGLTSSFVHEMIFKLKGRILVIIKGKIKVMELKLIC